MRTIVMMVATGAVVAVGTLYGAAVMYDQWMKRQN